MVSRHFHQQQANVDSFRLERTFSVLSSRTLPFQFFHHGRTVGKHLEISQIIAVFHVEDDRLDVIFKTIDADPDGFPVHGIAVGETTVDSLVGAFGWSPDWLELDPIEILLNRPRADAAS